MEGRPRRYTDEELIECIQALANDLGRSPTVSDVRNLSEKMPNVSTYEDRFGSWNNALRTAGYEGLHDLSGETILTQLAKFALSHDGRMPTKREVDANPDMVSSGTLRNRFGSYAEAIRIAKRIIESCDLGYEV